MNYRDIPEQKALEEKINTLRELIKGNMWCARFRRILKEEDSEFEEIRVGELIDILKQTHDEIKNDRFEKKAPLAGNGFRYNDENFL